MRVLALLLCLGLFGCEKNIKQFKHFKSGTIGINRKVQLVSCSDGKVLREWSGRFMIEVQNGMASWLDANNNDVKISGCFVIEEI